MRTVQRLPFFVWCWNFLLPFNPFLLASMVSSRNFNNAMITVMSSQTPYFWLVESFCLDLLSASLAMSAFYFSAFFLSHLALHAFANASAILL
jgi:hypothetical protein